MRTSWIGCAMAMAMAMGCGGGAATADAGRDDAAREEADATIESDAGSPVEPPIERGTIARFTDACVAAPVDLATYGAITEYDRYEVANPAWIGGDALPVVVLAPVGGAAAHPAVFFAHPFGATDWSRVRSLLEMLVSHDLVVVFTPYPTTGATVCERYDVLWSGHAAAVDALGSALGIETTRVGFVGHSFGGGATPWLGHQALVGRGWGASGSFLLSSAPWYVHRMDDAAWAELATTRMLVMVYRDDDVNDHAIAIDEVFEPFPGTRSYVMLDSDANGACELVADHVTPATDSAVEDAVTLDALDVWGLWRKASALARCALRADAAACAVADGTAIGADEMGTWISDGTAVAPAARTSSPAPVEDGASYMFPASRRDAFPCEGR